MHTLLVASRRKRFLFRKDDAMKRIHRFNNQKEPKLRCPACSYRLEAKTIVRTCSGASRTLSAAPGELTQCPHCKSMLEYGEQHGSLTVERARPQRVRAFEELERETPGALRLPELIAYVKRFRTMPPKSPAPQDGTIRFRYFLS
jgi:hypothetical protein